MATLHLGRIAEPEKLERLSNERPDPARHPNIVGDYDVTPKGGRKANPNGPWIQCSHCRKDNHWIGYIVEEDNENNGAKRHLIGNMCGYHHYGAERFRRAKNLYRAESKHAALLQRFDAFYNALDRIENAISVLLGHESLVCIEEKRKEIKTACPDLVARLSALLKSGGQLTRLVPGRNEKGQKTLITQHLGALEGGSLISSDIRLICTDLRQALHRIRLTSGTPPTATSELSKLVIDAERALDQLKQETMSLADARRFFGRKNLRRITAWAEPFRRHFHVVLVDQGLELARGEDVARILTPLAVYRLPKAPEI